MKIINDIFLLLTNQQKNKSFFLIFLMIVSSLAELLSLGLLIVILNFFLNIDTKLQLNFIFSYFSDINFLRDFLKINYILLFLLIIFT
jgi:hypothetical protein